MTARLRKNFRGILFIIIVLAAGGAALYYHYTHATPPTQYQTEAEQDPSVRFVMEAYDSIVANYWMKPDQFTQFGLPAMPDMFSLALKQATGKDATLATTTRTGIANMVKASFAAATSTDEKHEWALNTVNLVVNTLVPTGRSRLLSQAQETQLRQEVSNIKPENDLYAQLGAQTGASVAAVEAAYTQKVAEINHSTSTDKQAELAQASYAKKVLTTESSKEMYDQNHIEPTVFVHVIGKTLYMYAEQIAPTTLQEIGRAVDDASTTPMDSIILDLRGNIGGALDFATAFLGLFIGPNQYAYDLYHQADYQPQRTTLQTFGDLERYKGNIAILIDNMTQSTAELTSAIFKRYNLARVVGATTRGWGSVENTYPLTTSLEASTTYSLLLVNSLTLGDTNQPIEQNGVAPDISITDKNWRSELAHEFTSQSLIAALSQEADKAPLK